MPNVIYIGTLFPRVPTSMRWGREPEFLRFAALGPIATMSKTIFLSYKHLKRTFKRIKMQHVKIFRFFFYKSVKMFEIFI
jgi:hypothetical protein